MVLRLAYFVLVHSIPHELCLNGDHTGIMFTLAKGKMWITKAMHESKDKSVNNHGEKRQFTVLATTSAAGQMLPHQVVVAGKTAGSLPKFGKFKISLNGMNTNKVPKLAVCFVLTTLVQAVANIASFCTTYNHWSDNITSKAYVKDIVVPYFKAKIETMRAINPRAGASPSTSRSASSSSTHGGAGSTSCRGPGQAKVPMDPAHLRASRLHTGGAADGPRRDRQAQGDCA